MGFSDYFKRFINASDDYDDNDDVVEEVQGEGFDAPRSYPSYDEPDTSRHTPRQRRTSSTDSNRVVDIRTTAMLQVVLVKPDKFDDARAIADHLNEKRTVVLNLESASKDVARRLIDLLNGVAYANGGQLKKVSTNTYIITPYNVNVSGDLLDELENTGVFF